MHRVFVGLLIAVFMAPTGGFAQTTTTNDGRDRTIRTPAIQRSTGIMREAGRRESIRLAALPVVLRQQPARQRRWPGRHPVLFGALLGLGIGLGVEAAVIPGKSGGEPHSVYIPMFGTIGAGIGSVTGWIVSVARR